MKKLSYYLTSTPFKWDFILFPILSALMELVIQVTHVSFDVIKVLNIELWINSFMVTFLTYMVFQVVALKFSYLQKFKYTWAAISFAFSTFLGGALSYTMKEELKPINWFYSIVFALLFGAACLYFIYNGANLGEEKAAKEIKRAISEYNEFIESIDDSNKDALLCVLNQALEVEDQVFQMIVDFQSKNNIKGMIKDLEISKNKKME